MAAETLTRGSVTRMCSQEGLKEAGWNPVVQVTDLRVVNGAESERYRVRISDGVNFQHGMLASQLSCLVASGRLRRGSLVRLLEIVCAPVKGRLIILIINMEMVRDECDIIGQPVLLPKSAIAQPSANEPASGLSAERPGMGSTGGLTYPNSARHGATNAPSMFSEPETGDRSYNHPKIGSGNPSTVTGSYTNQNLGTGNSTPVSLPYNGQNRGLFNPRPEVYHRAPQLPYQQTQPMHSNEGPIAKNDAPARITPITALDPCQGRWTIKARVTARGELRHYNNPNGDGKVFSFDLLDAEGGEIRATCFNAVADRFYNQIEVGKVYIISRGSLKPAKKNFNYLRNDQEIFLENASVVQLCYEDDDSIPLVQFHFGFIRDIEEMENNYVVDLIGVVSSVGPAGSITRKNGLETRKRVLQLEDTSGRSVELTLWGNFCTAEGQRLQNMCDSGLSPVLAVKSARIYEFNGRSVGTIASSQLYVEPEFHEAHMLREWFEREGKNAPSISISRKAGSLGRK